MVQVAPRLGLGIGAPVLPTVRPPISTFGAGGSQLLPLTVNFIQNDGTRGTSLPSGLVAPCVVALDIRDTAGVTETWDFSYDFGETGAQLVDDPDDLSYAPGTRVALRGTQRDLGTDLRGPTGIYLFENPGTYLLRIWGRDDTGVNNDPTHYFETWVTVGTPSYTNDVVVDTGGGGDYTDLQTAINSVANNSRIELTRGQTFSGQFSVNGRNRIFIEAATGAGADPILQNTGSNNTLMSISEGGATPNNQHNIYLRGVEFRPSSSDLLNSGALNNASVGCVLGYTANSCVYDCTMVSGDSTGSASVAAFGFGWQIFASGGASATYGPAGCLMLRCRRASQANGISCNGQTFKTQATLDCGFIGCQGDTSSFEDVFRALQDGAAQRDNAATSIVWCDLNYDLHSNKANGKDAMRWNGVQWYWAQECVLTGKLGFPASDGGGGTTYLQVRCRAEGCFLRQQTLIDQSGASIGVGAEGNDMGWTSCILLYNRQRPTDTSPVNGVQQSNSSTSRTTVQDRLYFKFLTCVSEENTAAASGQRGAGFLSHFINTADNARNDWTYRGLLVIAPDDDSGLPVPDGSGGNQTIMVIDVENFEDVTLLSQDNVFPQASARGTNFFSDAGGGGSFATWQAFPFSSGEIEEAHAAGACIANGYLPHASEATGWATKCTPDPTVKRDYNGTLRDQMASTWAAGAIIP